MILVRELYDGEKGFGKVSINEGEEQLKKVLKEIQELSKLIGTDGETLKQGSFESNIDFHFKRENLLGVMYKLESTYNEQLYLFKEVSVEGLLSKNEMGRYEFGNGEYLTSGSSVEVLTYDSFKETDVWRLGRIEHSMGDYYHTSLGKEVKLDNVRARLRR